MVLMIVDLQKQGRKEERKRKPRREKKICDSSKKEDAKSITGEQCNDVTRG